MSQYQKALNFSFTKSRLPKSREHIDQMQRGRRMGGIEVLAESSLSALQMEPGPPKADWDDPAVGNLLQSAP